MPLPGINSGDHLRMVYTIVVPSTTLRAQYALVLSIGSNIFLAMNGDTGM